jgi:hypothetical protein
MRDHHPLRLLLTLLTGLLLPAVALAKLPPRTTPKEELWIALGDSVPVFLAMGLCALGMWIRARQRGTPLRVEWQLRPNHAFQTALHGSIFCYWLLHWADLAWHIPLILVEIAFCYLLEMLVSWARSGVWQVAIGPIPIVMSTNFFLVFKGHNFKMFFLLFTVAILAKHFIVWPKTKTHVFNPSAIGMAAVITLWTINRLWPIPGVRSGLFSYQTVFHPFGMPPNMTEWLLLLALIWQMRFPNVLVCFGAFLGFALPGLSDATPPYLLEPAIFIAVTFLISDPRTSAQQPLGKLFFGASYAVSVRLMDAWLTWLIGIDGDAKVLGLALCCLAVPLCDGVGAWICERLPRLDAALSPRWNKVHVLLWLAVMVPQMLDGAAKRTTFLRSVADFERYYDPWVIVVDKEQMCEANPAHCKPFSFYDELVILATRERQPRPTGDPRRPNTAPGVRFEPAGMPEQPATP